MLNQSVLKGKAQESWGKWPIFSQEQIRAVVEVLQSGKVNYWTGYQCHLFEQAFANFCGVKHAVSLANGTVALELALEALGIGANDEVIVSSRTFIASASAILMRGAIPVFADVDLVSQNITGQHIARVITSKTRAIIVVHLAGWPCEMEAILSLAKTYRLAVIEDCAQAHGARYSGKKVGALGDVAAFSFCQDKIMTTGGEGGMLLTNHRSVWEKAWSFKDHGKHSCLLAHNNHSSSMFRWLHDQVGTNWRMTEMQAAIGLAQLEHLNGWLAKRKRYANLLSACFSNVKGLRVTIPDKRMIEHAYYKYYVFVDPRYLKSGWCRDRIISLINDANVPCFPGACPEVYLENALKEYAPPKRFPNAKLLGETSLMFLVHPTLKLTHIRQVCDVVTRVMSLAVQ